MHTFCKMKSRKSTNSIPFPCFWHFYASEIYWATIRMRWVETNLLPEGKYYIIWIFLLREYLDSNILPQKKFIQSLVNYDVTISFDLFPTFYLKLQINLPRRKIASYYFFCKTNKELYHRRVWFVWYFTQHIGNFDNLILAKTV